jgi:hypothetical protein
VLAYREITTAAATHSSSQNTRRVRALMFSMFFVTVCPGKDY